MNSIVAISGTKIRNENGLYSLNDLHKASGSLAKHKPSNWLANKQTSEIIEEIEKAGIPAIQSKQRLGTFVCKELVIHYGMWISPEFSLKVIRTFLAVEQAKFETISIQQQHEIKEAVHQNVSRTGRTFQAVYHDLYLKFQIPKYQDLLARDFEAAMKYLEAPKVIEKKPSYLLDIPFDLRVNRTYRVTVRDGQASRCAVMYASLQTDDGTAWAS